MKYEKSQEREREREREHEENVTLRQDTIPKHLERLGKYVQM
jgi:hypothetical protein